MITYKTYSESQTTLIKRLIGAWKVLIGKAVAYDYKEEVNNG